MNRKRNREDFLRRMICLSAMTAFLVLPGASLYAQDVDVIETQIGYDQMVPGQKTPDSGNKDTADKARSPSLSSQDRPFVLLNESLKNAIEENNKLLKENISMRDELKKLRGKNTISQTRINALKRKMDELLKKDRPDVADKSAQYQREIQTLQKTLSQTEQEYASKIEKLQQALSAAQEKEDLLKEGISEQEAHYNQKVREMAKEVALKRKVEKLIPLSVLLDEPGAQEPAGPEVYKSLNLKNLKLKLTTNKLIQDIKEQAMENLKDFKSNVKKVAQQMVRLKKENKELKKNSAKLHYNMGNILFGQGKYELAKKEYERVVELLPHDPAAHYNLAFVSGEFLKDYNTALEHYQQYLALNPYAPDANWVQEKILEADLILKSKIDSPLETVTAAKKKK